MSFSQIFTLTVVPVVPLWLLMIFAPRWRWTVRIVSQPWSYAPLALVYAILVLTRLGEVAQVVVVNPRLDTVAPLLGTPAGATIAWVHFLAFDVFVGRWIYVDGRSRDVHPVVLGPILLLTFLFGPMGLLTYLVTSRLAVPALSRGQAAGPPPSPGSAAGPAV